MKIFLIGFMGSGKSTVGRRLAEKLSLHFIDFDKYIEKETGRTVPEIFETEGEEKFRSIEKEHLAKILSKENILLSLGGGTPCFFNNMEVINKNGTSVYLETSSEILAKRLLRSKTKRPLIRGKNESELKEFIELTLEKRNPYYKQSHHTVIIESQTIEEVADQIIKSIY